MPKKILIVKTTSMGDVIHALPAVADIKRVFADAQVDWVVENSFSDIVHLSPLVSVVHCVAVRHWRKALLSRATWQAVGAVKTALKDAHYDCVIDLQGLVKSAVIARWAKAPIYGYDRHSIKEPTASRFYQKTFTVSREMNAVERCRALCAQSLGYDYRDLPLQFSLSAPVRKEAAPYAAFLVNTSRETKLWNEQKWIELGRYCLTRGLNVHFLWASESEHERVLRLAQAIGQGAQVHPRMKIAECASVLAGAELVVGVDTGLTHLAAALDRPSVGMFLDYPVHLVALTGQKVKSLGGVGADPRVDEIIQAIAEVQG